MRIGELAEPTGVSARSLRYYENQGLLRAHLTPAGHRRCTFEDVERVVRIQQLYDAGLCSRVIAELLPCLDAPPQERTGHLDTRLAQEHQRLETVVREAVRARDTLEEVNTDLGRP